MVAGETGHRRGRGGRDGSHPQQTKVRLHKHNLACNNYTLSRPSLSSSSDSSDVLFWSITSAPPIVTKPIYFAITFQILDKYQLFERLPSFIKEMIIFNEQEIFIPVFSTYRTLLNCRFLRFHIILTVLFNSEACFWDSDS